MRKIRSLIDPSIPIVVKDNPLNSSGRAYPRPSNYSSYVKAVVDNIMFAPIHCSSRELIAKSICTFSVNGTASFESSIMGVPSVFGGRSIFYKRDESMEDEELHGVVGALVVVTSAAFLAVDIPTVQFQ